MKFLELLFKLLVLVFQEFSILVSLTNGILVQLVADPNQFFGEVRLITFIGKCTIGVSKAVIILMDKIGRDISQRL